ncbi:MAG: VOC family protein [Planctomycetes bacterium]|nr:VOC family protein [Planctomycetota bacterium]
MKKLTPNLMVESVDETIVFYRDVLGFKVVMTLPEAGVKDFAILQWGNVELMLQSRKSIREDLPFMAEQPIGASSILYVEVEGIQALHDRISGKVSVLLPMRKTFYGMQEFCIRDPHGYVIVFAEPVA